MDNTSISSLSRKRKYSKDSSVDATESKISTLKSESFPSQGHIVKRHQPSFTFKEKLAILKRLENETVNIVSKEFNINERTLRRWKNRRNEIEIMSKKENISNHKKNRSPANEELENALYIWFLQARTRGIPISGTILKHKAIEINDALGGDKSFKASDGWLDKWKHRKDIKSLKVTEENISADFKAGNDYVKKLKTTVTNKYLDRAQVFNLNETSLLYKMLPSMTLASKNESQAAGFKSNKDRVTVVACCNADGSFKLPLLVVGKFAKPRCLKDSSMAKLPVTYKSQKNALMDVTIFTEWFKEIFVLHVRIFLAKMGLPRRAILIVDNYKTHTYLKDGDIEVIFLPTNVTSIIQPLDRGILETLKRQYRLNLIKKIVEAQEKEISLVQFVKDMNIKDAIFWIDESWQQITKNTIYRCWNKIWYAEKKSVAVQTDDDPLDLTLFNSVEIEKDDVSMEQLLLELRRVRGFNSIEKDFVYDWVHGDDDLVSECLTAQDIVTQLRNTRDESLH